MRSGRDGLRDEFGNRAKLNGTKPLSYTKREGEWKEKKKERNNAETQRTQRGGNGEGGGSNADAR